MTFDLKPGHGSLFKNDRKSKDIHPDYRGTLCLTDGSTVQLGGWIKQGKGGKYLAITAGNALPARQEPD